VVCVDVKDRPKSRPKRGPFGENRPRIGRKPGMLKSGFQGDELFNLKTRETND
jgi:hypothetical protein